MLSGIKKVDNDWICVLATRIGRKNKLFICAYSSVVDIAIPERGILRISLESMVVLFKLAA